MFYLVISAGVVIPIPYATKEECVKAGLMQNSAGVYWAYSCVPAPKPPTYTQSGTFEFSHEQPPIVFATPAPYFGYNPPMLCDGDITKDNDSYRCNQHEWK